MVPFLKDFSVSLFPIKIQTDQAIAKLNEEQSVKPSKKEKTVLNQGKQL